MITREELCQWYDKFTSPLQIVKEEIQVLDDLKEQSTEPETTNERYPYPESWFAKPKVQVTEIVDIKRVESTVVDKAKEQVEDIQEIFDRVTGDLTDQLFKRVLDYVTTDKKIKDISSSNLIGILSTMKGYDKQLSSLKNYLYEFIRGIAGGSWDVFGWIWNGLKSIVNGIVNGIKKPFEVIWNGLKTLGNIVRGGLQTTINWTYKGFETITAGFTKALGAIVDGIRSAWNYFLLGLSKLWDILLSTLNALFKITEGVVMKYAMWQARAAYEIGKTVSETFG